jgi:hypothetical protein
VDPAGPELRHAEAAEHQRTQAGLVGDVRGGQPPPQVVGVGGGRLGGVGVAAEAGEHDPDGRDAELDAGTFAGQAAAGGPVHGGPRGGDVVAADGQHRAEQVRGGPRLVVGQLGEHRAAGLRIRRGQQPRDPEPVDGHARRVVPRADRDGVVDGLRELVAFGVPAGGLAVQAPYQIGMPPGQFVVQHLAELVLVAEQGLVDRLDERVCPDQLVEAAARVVPAGHPVGEVGMHLLDDARPQQHVADTRLLGVEDLGAQELRDRLVPGRMRGTGRPAHAGVARHRVQADGGHPTLGAFVQCGGLTVGQPHAVRLEHLGRLVQGEGQLVGADLGELTGQLVAVERNDAGAAADHDQAQPGRRVAQQKVQVGGDGPVVDHFGPVQDEDRRGRPGGQAGGQPGQDRPVDRTGLGRRGDVRIQAGHAPPQRVQDVGPEKARRVVVVVERQPGHRSRRRTGPCPIRRQCGFSRTRGTGDGGESRTACRRQQIEQSLAEVVGRRDGRDSQFGG